jgi:hypothetical protein
MRKAVGAAAGALLFLSLAPAAVDAGKRIVPGQVAQARYVALGYDMGGDRFRSEADSLTDPDVLPEERRALQAIADDLRAWGKYVVTVRPEQAELLIAIRVGRHGSVSGGVGLGPARPGQPPMTGAVPGLSGGSGSAELSSSDDMLTVYEGTRGRIGAPLWRVKRKGGLAGELPMLFQEFRADVERTPAPEKQEPPKKAE